MVSEIDMNQGQQFLDLWLETFGAASETLLLEMRTVKSRFRRKVTNVLFSVV